MDNKNWTMPKWMEKYRGLIFNTGGNPIEDLMNDHETNIFNNSVRAMLCISVKGQIDILESLHSKGYIK